MQKIPNANSPSFMSLIFAKHKAKPEAKAINVIRNKT